MYLLSQYGERHEDRLPEGIFSSLEKIKEFLTVTDSFVSERLVATDYNRSAVELILFYSSKEEFENYLKKNKMKLNVNFMLRNNSN